MYKINKKKKKMEYNAELKLLWLKIFEKRCLLSVNTNLERYH